MDDDKFLYELRATPPPQFAEQLRKRLERLEPAAPVKTMTYRRSAVAALLVLAVALLAFPSVRASAQAFLSLFRVVNFTAVPVDVNRIGTLGQSGIDLPSLIGQQVQVLQEPGPTRVFSTLDEAALAIGIAIKQPKIVPPSLYMVRIEMEDGRALRITTDTGKLQDVLTALAITDARVPTGLDGQLVTLRVRPILRLVYANGNREVAFVQAASPEVTVPAGFDLAALGEIGLRIAGLDASHAHTLAQAIDWQGTLVVPVPAGASTFRQVQIRGNRGLLVASTERADIKAVLWSDRGSVYAITGPLDDRGMLQMAESVE